MDWVRWGHGAGGMLKWSSERGWRCRGRRKSAPFGCCYLAASTTTDLCPSCGTLPTCQPRWRLDDAGRPVIFPVMDASQRRLLRQLVVAVQHAAPTRGWRQGLEVGRQLGCAGARLAHMQGLQPPV